jgi:hypothetical protein
MLAGGVIDCAKKTVQWEGLGGLYKVRRWGSSSCSSGQAARLQLQAAASLNCRRHISRGVSSSTLRSSLVDCSHQLQLRWFDRSCHSAAPYHGGSTLYLGLPPTQQATAMQAYQQHWVHLLCVRLLSKGCLLLDSS